MRSSLLLVVAFLALIIAVAGQNQNEWRVCKSLRASCQTDIDCCSDACVDGFCCGRSGDQGCQMGNAFAGAGTNTGTGDGAGGCCPKNYCEYNGQTRTTQCQPTI